MWIRKKSISSLDARSANSQLHMPKASAATLDKAWGSDCGPLHLSAPVFSQAELQLIQLLCNEWGSRKVKLTVGPFRDPPIRQTGSQPTYLGLLRCRSGQPRRGAPGGGILDANLMRPSHSGCGFWEWWVMFGWRDWDLYFKEPRLVTDYEKKKKKKTYQNNNYVTLCNYVTLNK